MAMGNRLRAHTYHACMGTKQLSYTTLQTCVSVNNDDGFTMMAGGGGGTAPLSPPLPPIGPEATPSQVN